MLHENLWQEFKLCTFTTTTFNVIGGSGHAGASFHPYGRVAQSHMYLTNRPPRGPLEASDLLTRHMVLACLGHISPLVKELIIIFNV